MAQVFLVTSGSAALVANTLKTAVQLATGAAVQNRIVQVDITFNGVTASAVPVQVDIVKTTGASSGGAAATPTKANTDARAAAATTARINDTTPGVLSAVQSSYFVPPTSGLSIQFPLGREPGMTVSEFWEVRLNAAAAVSYIVNVWFEE